MTNHKLTDLDGQITSVARHMTDADPPVDLRDRVLAQLDPRASSPWMWKLIPATAGLLALLLIAVMLVRRSPSPTHPSEVQALAPAMPEPSPAPNARTTDDSNAATSGAAIHAAARQVATHPAAPRIADVEAEWQARALPALPQPEALTMGGIQPEVLAIRPLETRPLVIAPIGAEDRF